MTWVAAVHGVATLFLVGLIWYVQIVHYPLMAAVGNDRFPAYARAHAARTSWIVTAPMLLEVATAITLLVEPPTAAIRPILWLGVGLLALVWASTFGLQVPCHRRLASGFDPRAHLRLVRTNWLRTLAWTGRVPVAVAVLLAV